MCDCHECNMSKESHENWEEEYVKWQYEQYKKQMATVSIAPLSFDDWLKSLSNKSTH